MVVSENHSGTWQNRTKEAHLVRNFAIAMIAAGALGGFMGAETEVMKTLIAMGSLQLSAALGILVAGKVSQDNATPIVHKLEDGE